MPAATEELVYTAHAKRESGIGKLLALVKDEQVLASETEK